MPLKPVICTEDEQVESRVDDVYVTTDRAPRPINSVFFTGELFQCTASQWPLYVEEAEQFIHISHTQNPEHEL